MLQITQPAFQLVQEEIEKVEGLAVVTVQDYLATVSNSELRNIAQANNGVVKIDTGDDEIYEIKHKVHFFFDAADRWP